MAALHLPNSGHPTKERAGNRSQSTVHRADILFLIVANNRNVVVFSRFAGRKNPLASSFALLLILVALLVQRRQKPALCREALDFVRRVK